MKTTTTWSKENDAPLPWSDLRQRLNEATWAWLSEQQEQQHVEAEDEDETEAQPLSWKTDNDDDDDEDEYYPRVHQWSSSVTEAGGVLHMATAPDQSSTTPGSCTARRDNDNHTPVVQVQFILSDAPGGHGDTLWPAARHIANLMADPVHCRRLLGMIPDNDDDGDKQPHHHQHHPLQGKRVLELGAGAGLPSWTALHCGASLVVCTDQPIAARLVSLAEAAERNMRQIQTTNNPTNTSLLIKPQQVVQVCAYSWGTPVEDMLRALPPTHVSVAGWTTTSGTKREHDDNDDDDLRRFDVVVAADCIYMPDCHGMLLQSIQQFLRPRQGGGVALLPFALHGNVPDAQVWSLVETARNHGFVVELLESQQLTTSSSTTLDAKRALIHTLRLTLP